MQFPAIDPVAFSIGSLQLRWYGLMYLLAFFVGWGLARWRASRPGSGWKTVDVDDLLTFVMLGVILGARLGYVLFYDLPAYIDDPGEILRIWNGGMSFHGGLLGVLCAFWYFARTRKKSFLEVSDFIAPLVPQGLFWGRMGNFINGELWGKVSDVPWAMVFPTGGPWPRHPSQLYERLLEAPRSSMKACWKGWCCSWCSGSSPPGRARRAPSPVFSPCSTPCSASAWNSCACPMPSWATWPLAG